jgi:hypothetical protein
MIPLNDQRWKDFDGGYRDKYDASIPLSRLEGGVGEFDLIWSELWENLYHQGDVGIASYAVVPQIARIIQSQRILDYNPFALTVAIELARGRGKNPEPPDWLKEDYDQALWEIAKYGCDNLNQEWDSSILKSLLALVAIIKGNRDLGELIFELDDGYEKDLLDRFFEG